MVRRKDSHRERTHRSGRPVGPDTYLSLARDADSVEESLIFYEQAMMVAQRQVTGLASVGGEAPAGAIAMTGWYMVAREGVAHCLAQMGRAEEAAAHCMGMLRLDPDDYHGVRYLLVTLLLQMNRHEELGELLVEFAVDESAHLEYARALLAYREEGESPRADQLLARAVAGNPYVPDYLLGQKPFPDSLPEYAVAGGESEAISCAVDSRGVWLDWPGAITWLRKKVKAPIPAPRRRRRPSWPAARDVLRLLPQAPGDSWQVDAVPSDPRGPVKSRGVAPWVIVIVDSVTGDVVALEAVNAKPKPADLWNGLVSAMRNPQHADAHRPAQIEVRQKTLANAWRKKLEEIEVAITVSPRLEAIQSIVALLPVGPSDPASTPLTATATRAVDLRDLPMEFGEVWQADLRRMPAWVTGEGEPYRAWLGMVVSCTSQMVLATDLVAQRPQPGWLWEVLEKAMRHPMCGTAHRPAKIELAAIDQRDLLAPLARRADVECVVADQLQVLDAAVAELGQFMSGDHTAPSVLQSPGIKLEQVASFYAAAAEFYRRKPWRRVQGDTPIRVECDKFDSGPWLAVVMGQSGVQQGLAIYEDEDALRKLIHGKHGDDQKARAMSAVSLMFSEAFEMHVADLDAAEEHGWPVGGPEAYPLVLRVNPGCAVRAPLVWELELLDGCARAIPDFLEKNQSPLVAVVPAAAGQLTLRLSWVNWR
jgi:hypothetical protein